MFCTKCDLVVMAMDLHIEGIQTSVKKFLPRFHEFCFTAILLELASEQGAMHELNQWINGQQYIWTEITLFMCMCTFDWLSLLSYILIFLIRVCVLYVKSYYSKTHEKDLLHI